MPFYQRGSRDVRPSVRVSVTVSHSGILYQNEHDFFHWRRARSLCRYRVNHDSKWYMNWQFSTFKPPYLQNGAKYDQCCYWSLIGSRIRAFVYVWFGQRSSLLTSWRCLTLIDTSMYSSASWRSNQPHSVTRLITLEWRESARSSTHQYIIPLRPTLSTLDML